MMVTNKVREKYQVQLYLRRQVRCLGQRNEEGLTSRLSVTTKVIKKYKKTIAVLMWR